MEKVEITLSNLPGWNALPDGNYNITVSAKGEGYTRQIQSSPVQANKTTVPTSAQYFSFDGSKVTAYNGSDTKIVIPRSYSLGAQEIEITGNKAYVKDPTQWGTRPSDAARFDLLFTDMTFTDGTKTITYTSGADFIAGLKNGGDFPDYSAVWFVSVTVKSSANVMSVSNYFSDTPNGNFLVYPITLYRDGNYYTLSEHTGNSAPFAQGATTYGAGNYITATVPVDGNDYQVDTIGMNFKGSRDITSITLLDNITTIEQGAFNGWEALNTIIMGSGVQVVNNQSFYITVDLPCNLYYRGTLKQYAEIQNTSTGSTSYPLGGRIQTQNSSIIKNEVYINGSTNPIKSLVIPDTTSHIIEAGAFRRWGQIEHVELEEGITTIETRAFMNMPSLKTIILPSTITSIGSDAFRNENHYEWAGDILPSSRIITCNATIPPDMTDYAFGDSFDGTVIEAIYVPAESVEDYKVATGWAGYADVIQAKPE